QAPCQTPVSSRSWSRSVTTTKFHGCQFLADGASLPASRTLARSSSRTGADENSRTLRRDLKASQVSTAITLRPTGVCCLGDRVRYDAENARISKVALDQSEIVHGPQQETHAVPFGATGETGGEQAVVGSE